MSRMISGTLTAASSHSGWVTGIGDNPDMSMVEPVGGVRDGVHVVMVCTGNICRSAMAEIVLVDRLLAAGVPVLPNPGTAPQPRQGRGSHRVPGAGTAVPARPGTGGGSVDQVRGVIVTSAGVSDEEQDNPIDTRAARVLAEHGYGQGTGAAAGEVAARIRSHRARRISDAELAGADLVLAMTARHLRELERRAARLSGLVDGWSRSGSLQPGGVTHLGGVLAGPRLRLYRALDPAVAGAPDVPDPWYGTMADFEDTLEVVERVSDALVAALTGLLAPDMTGFEDQSPTH